MRSIGMPPRKARRWRLELLRTINVIWPTDELEIGHGTWTWIAALAFGNTAADYHSAGDILAPLRFDGETQAQEDGSRSRDQKPEYLWL
jgi:hypothetical protein